MTARLAELLVFSFLLPIALWGLARAFRKDRTWIAGAAVAVALCAFCIVLTLMGYTLMGGGHYGIDHRVARNPAGPGEVVLAVVAALVPVVAWFLLRSATRRRRR